jgi:S1-C subfamily serine protease
VGRSRVVAVVAAAALLGALVGAGLTATLRAATSPGAGRDGGLPVRAAADVGAGDGVAAVARAVLPSVVRIDVRGIGVGASGEGGGASGNASGVVWDEDGHVVTNHHVVAGATEIAVTTADGVVLEAGLVGSDPGSDLAVLRVDVGDHPPVAVAEGPAEIGQLVVVLGAPYGLDGSVTAGVVSAVDRPVDLRVPDGSTVRLPGVVQTDAGISPGSSGGPVVDADGRLVGIASAVLGEAYGGAVGFAIPADLVVDVVGQLIRDGTVTTPVLGLAGTAVGGAVADARGVTSGVVVERVSAGSPAAAADLRPGDVLTAVDGEPIRTVDDLLRAVRRAGVGGTIEIAHIRDGIAGTATATLAGAAGDETEGRTR